MTSYVFSMLLKANILICILLIWSVFERHAVKAQSCYDAPPLEIQGRHFFNPATNEYIPIRGLAYYPRPNAGVNDVNNLDFLTEDFRDAWTRDIEQFKSLHINLVRIYAVDPSKNHDAFMCALKSAGIYVLLELSAACQGCAVTSDASPACYPDALKTRGEFIISVFSNYDNILGFSAGNEAGLTYQPVEKNAPCQKKFVRDMRAFIQSCPNMRKIPVGVVVADVDNEKNAYYYNCRTNKDDELENVEWYGLNSYRQCNGAETDYTSLSGLSSILTEFSAYQMPSAFMLAEFGCIDPSFPTVDGYPAQRTWLEAKALSLPEYWEEISGGVAFEYSTETYRLTKTTFPFKQFDNTNFGVGYFSPSNCDDISTPCEYTRYPQFDNLSNNYATAGTVSPPSSTSTRPILECPSSFAALDDFVWPSDSVASWTCPKPYTIYCPATPGCTPPTPLAASATTPSPTGVPLATKASSPAPTAVSPPTNSPTGLATMKASNTDSTNADGNEVSNKPSVSTSAPTSFRSNTTTTSVSTTTTSTTSTSAVQVVMNSSTLAPTVETTESNNNGGIALSPAPSAFPTPSPTLLPTLLPTISPSIQKQTPVPFGTIKDGSTTTKPSPSPTAAVTVVDNTRAPSSAPTKTPKKAFGITGKDSTMAPTAQLPNFLGIQSGARKNTAVCATVLLSSVLLFLL